MEGGRYSAALQDFMSALDMVDGGDAESWRMLLAIAVTYDQMGQLGHAAEFHRKFLMRAQKHAEFLTPAWAKRVEKAKEDVNQVMKKAASTHGFLSVVSQPPEATLVVNGRPAGAMGDASTPFLLFLEPGVHTIRVTRSGYLDEERRVKIAAAAIRALDIVLTPGSTSASARVLAPVEELTPPSPRPEPALALPPHQGAISPDVTDGGSIGPWLTLGVGGAALVVGAVLSGLSASERAGLQETKESLFEDPQRYAALSESERLLASQDWDAAVGRVERYDAASIALYATGGAALVGGVLWWALSDEAAPVQARWELTPLPGGLYGQAAVRF